jgi:voltage-gated potassium channel
VRYAPGMRPTRGRFVQSRIDAFLADPASPGRATRVIIVLTVGTVLIGSLVIWLLDPEEDFPDFATALWFTLQTVTTVGYGDVTPVTLLGRAVAGLVMVISLAFMAIVTALVTSTFVEAAQARRRDADTAAQDDANERLGKQLLELSARLTAIEGTLARLAGEPIVPAPSGEEPGAQTGPVDD